MSETDSVYEIINPSDPYTLKASSFKVAAAATTLLGEGAWGLRGVGESEETMPVLLFGGGEEWLTQQDMWPIGDFIDANHEAVVQALDTVLIGDANERIAFDRAMAAVTSDADRQAAWAAYHEEKRSSLRDIGGYAKELVQYLREPK